ncbi:hypothetical protein KJ840_00620 [Patescibacteria group bacterium]|nr:hypothetical protein [Patescibacteria group bacterium]
MREGKILGLDREFWLRRSKKNRMWKHDECGESFWIDDLRKTSNVVRILLFDGETELGRTEIELQEPLYASILEGLAGARGSSELIKELTKILKQ